MIRIITVPLGLFSIYLFATHVVADAIYIAVMTIWIDKLGERW